jgi:hypothetical protein
MSETQSLLTDGGGEKKKKDDSADEKDSKKQAEEKETIVKRQVTFGQQPDKKFVPGNPLQYNKSQRVLSKLFCSEWKPMCGVVSVALFLITLIIWLIIERNTRESSLSIDEQARFVASVLCKDRYDHSRTSLPGSIRAGEAPALEFSYTDLTTNDTHIVYYHPILQLQVTNVLRGGLIYFTEILDEERGLVAIYPNGRTKASSSEAGDLCILRNRTNEESWGDIGCQKARYVGFDATQTRPSTEVKPSVRMESFFYLPLSCAALEQSSVDMSRPEDQKRNTNLLIMSQHILSGNSSLLTFALTDLITRMQMEFGIPYSERPALGERLIAAFGRWEKPLVRQFAIKSMDPSKFDQRPLKNTTDLCCRDDPLCQRIVQARQSSLGSLCNEFRHCSAEQEQAWFEDTEPPRWPVQDCISDQHRCYCVQDFVQSLKTPGLVRCGDCLDDETACDCYALVWLFQFLNSQLPCFCKGLCSTPAASYVCRVERVCDSWVPEDCQVTIHWCPRLVDFPCHRCHLGLFPDQSDTCGGGS